MLAVALFAYLGTIKAVSGFAAGLACIPGWFWFDRQTAGFWTKALFVVLATGCAVGFGIHQWVLWEMSKAVPFMPGWLK